MNSKTNSIGKTRVLLRADAGSTIGFGHFVRTSTLAAYLRDDFECVLASFNPDGGLTDFQRKMVSESGAGAFALEARDCEEADRIFLESVAPGDIVVLDNYYFSTAYQKAVREKSRALVCIDDVHDRHFVADVVMTFCPLSRSDFSLEPYTRFYGGLEWSFLRQPFLEPHGSRENMGLPRRIVMAMGGADPFRLTDKMISAVRRILPEVRIDVIVGQTVEMQTPEDGGLKLWRKVSAADITLLFDKADLGIFPASTVCVEAFSRRLPVAAGFYVDNQEEFYRHGVKAGWFAPLDCLNDSEEEISARLLKAVKNFDGLKSPEFDFVGRKHDIIDVFKSLSVTKTPSQIL